MSLDGAGGGNSVAIRSTAVLNIGTVTANTTKDVTYAVSGAVAASSTGNGDKVHPQPQAANSSGVSQGESFVSAAGVVTTRFLNSTSVNVAAGTAVSYDVTLFKATGSLGA